MKIFAFFVVVLLAGFLIGCADPDVCVQSHIEYIKSHTELRAEPLGFGPKVGGLHLNNVYVAGHDTVVCDQWEKAPK